MGKQYGIRVKIKDSQIISNNMEKGIFEGIDVDKLIIAKLYLKLG